MINRLLNFLALPFWVLSIFTKNKSFGKNPVIKNRVLNYLGLHIFRVLLSHFISGLRFRMLSYLMASDERKKFHDDGFLLLHDFLPIEDFGRLEEEAINYEGDAAEVVQGDTATDRVWLSPKRCNELTACRQLLNSPDYRNRLRYCGATNTPPLFFIQAIRHHCIQGKADPQKTIHSDTFHPTMKAWLYLVDVTSSNGPFQYIRGSNRLTWKRIKWEYRKSVSTALNGGGGSFRFNDEDLKELGYSEPEVVSVPANTLVIVNTFGLHCRSDAEEGGTRVEIWAHSRVNPFNPFPGLSSKQLDRFRNIFIDWVMRYEKRVGKVSIVKANWSSGVKK